MRRACGSGENMADCELITLGGERRLYGVVEWPEGRPLGGVAIVHGWSGCRIGPHRILVEAARDLARRGIAALRFDLSGRGESEGDPLATDLDMMIADASAALDALRERLGREAPLGLLGMCSGGNVALASAAIRGDVRAVATWSTYPFQEQQVASQEVRRTGHFLKVYLLKALKPRTWLRLLRGRVDLRRVRRVLLGRHAAEERDEMERQRSRHDVLGALAGYRGWLLFVYGGRDPEAPAAERVFRAFCDEHGLRAEFHTVEGSNHNFYSLEWKRETLELTGQWLARALSE